MARRRADAEGHSPRARDGRELDVPLPSAGIADEMLTRARDLGYQHRDIAALLEVLARSGTAPVESSGA